MIDRIKNKGASTIKIVPKEEENYDYQEYMDEEKHEWNMADAVDQIVKSEAPEVEAHAIIAQLCNCANCVHAVMNKNGNVRCEAAHEINNGRWYNYCQRWRMQDINYEQ